MMRFRRKSNLAHRNIDLYEIVAWVIKITYIFVLPMSMNSIHNVFHVLLLHKYIGDSSNVLETEDIELVDDLSYEKK